MIFYIPDWADVQLMKTSSNAKIATLFSILSLVFRSNYTRGLLINKTVIIIFLCTFPCHTIYYMFGIFTLLSKYVQKTFLITSDM